MTLGALLSDCYQWADLRAGPIFLCSLALPVAGTLLARIGKAGKTDQDGRFIASAVVGAAILGLVFELAALSVAQAALGASLLQANVMLLAAPPVALGLCLAGMRWVFPLNELASVRTALDVGAFVLACAAAAWVFSKFRGWGIVFFGSLGQLAAFLILGALLLRRLARRAFGTNS